MEFKVFCLHVLRFQRKIFYFKSMFLQVYYIQYVYIFICSIVFTTYCGEQEEQEEEEVGKKIIFSSNVGVVLVGIGTAGEDNPH